MYILIGVRNITRLPRLRKGDKLYTMKVCNNLNIAIIIIFFVDYLQTINPLLFNRQIIQSEFSPT